MFGWLRRKMRRGHWADFLTLAQQRRVEALVLAWFERRGEAARLDLGFVEAGGLQYGLENVAQGCRPLPDDEWPSFVDAHFDTMVAAEAEHRDWEARRGDFAWAAPLLRLRLYHEDYVQEGRGEFLVHREDVPRTCSCLVADLPSAVVSVDSDQLASWRRSRDEVFDLALRQTLQECPVVWEQLAIGSEGATVTLHVASAEHFFVGTHALALHQHPGVTADLGALVGIPDRQTLVVLPLASTGGPALVGAISQFAALVAERHDHSPGAVSPHLYWWCADGTAAPRLTLQGVATRGGKVVVTPSPELLAVLERIARG